MTKASTTSGIRRGFPLPDPETIFSDFILPAGQPLAAAVSGGSDSLALLVLLHGFLADRARAGDLTAMTVDHRLRPQSGEEAQQVAAFCEARGIAHRIVSWDGAKPGTGLSAAAREARYALLADAAEAMGARLVLTGHTMDDQAETVAMRALRGTGRGLAGMARATLFDGRTWVCRPLLGMRRQALRDFLLRENVAWIEDPSNENARYERVRMRRDLMEAGAVEEWVARAHHAQAARRRSAEGAAAAVAAFVTMPAPGAYRVERAFFEEVSNGRVEALRALLALAGGTSFLPDEERTRALFAIVSAGRVRAGLSRAVIDARKDAVWLWREARNLPALPLSRPSIVWDGRWRVTAPEAKEGLVLQAGGALSASADVPPAVLAGAAKAHPMIVQDGVETDAERAGLTLDPVVGPYAGFLPDFDLALAGALHVLVGAAPVERPPLKEHIDAGP